MPEIFVSYRRADAANAAGRLCDHLGRRFGPDKLFRDVDSIAAGEDFDEAIHDALRSAMVLVVVIGPRWVEARDAAGRRRLDVPGDYVRREIEIAFGMDATVIPVLVDGAAPPDPARLPAPVRPLARRQAHELSDRRWNDDVLALIGQIERALGQAGTTIPGGVPLEPPWRLPIDRTTSFPGDLLSILQAPRRFIVRRVSERRRDRLASALVFFTLAVVLSDAALTGVYWPRDSVAGFLFSGLMLSTIATAAASAPLWALWGAVGARRHYRPLLVILLYQVGVIHLLVILASALGLLIVELGSVNVVTEAMTRALDQGGSVDAAISAVAETLTSAVDPRVVLIAMAVPLLGATVSAVFVLRSWGAYRDAFQLRRTQSIVAGLLVVAFAVLLAMLPAALG